MHSGWIRNPRLVARIVVLAALSLTRIGMFGAASTTAAGDKQRQTPALARGAEVVLLHGRIWTGEPYVAPGQKTVPARFAEAVAMADGRFLAVGTDEEIKAYIGLNTDLIDLHGRMAMPGFIDAHMHMMFGASFLSEVYLKDAHDETEFVQSIAEKAKSLAPGKWIQGGIWDETNWPDAKLPTRWMIDSMTSNNPVYIRRADGHGALANSLALKLAGISKDTPDPVGGVILRDPKTGEPTGVIYDAARFIIERAIPNPGWEEFEAALKAGLVEASKNGVTSVDDMNLGRWSPNHNFMDEIELLHRAELEGWLTCRFYEITPIEQWRQLDQAGISHAFGSDFVKIGAVKGYADGSIGSRTAWFFEDYSDKPGDTGLPRQSSTVMEEWVRGATAAGLQISVHAIGDRANAEMLNIFEKVGGSNPKAHRFRLEHAQHLRSEDIARFAKLGIVASMQPYHAIDDGRFVEQRIGHKRAETSYAWRSLLDAGVPLAFGSDWYIAPLNPLPGVYAAVTRATLDGKHPQGWIPEQRLTLEEALRAYTQGGAFAEFQEDKKGTIAPGKLADIIVLSDDLFKIPAEQIKSAKVVLTIVGGKVVYRGQGQQ